MKKCKWLNAGCFKFNYTGKISLKMKLTLMFILAGIIQVAAINSYSQTTRLTVELRNASVVEVLKAIETKSEFYFVYNKDAIDVDRKVDLNAKNLFIEEILDQLFKYTNVSYQITDRHIILSTLEGSQQQKTISGKVTNKQTGEPLIGATVMVKGTTNGTVTDMDGLFKLNTSSSDKILVFSYVGYISQEITNWKQSIINVALVEDAKTLDEVLVIGYGTAKKRDIVGAITKIKGGVLEKTNTTSIAQGLQGLSSGLNVTNRGGGF